MSKQIISATIMINKPESITTEYIENELTKKYKAPLRWAIIESKNDKLKLCITYEKEE